MKISHRPFYLFPLKQAVTVAAKRTILTACAFFVALWAFLGALFTPIPASAAEDVVSAFEQRNVLDDLESSVIGGKKFELKDYAFHAGIEPQVLLLTEFCYSYEPDRQSDYGLYLYVWNPQGLQFDVSSGRNAAEIACGDGRPEKYPLEFLNRSERADYEGLFYKFKVDLSAAQKGDVLADLNSSERVYHVSGVELLGQGAVNPAEYEANAVFYYSGYAKGYGPNESAESTLVYSRNAGEALTIRDGIHQTFYSPEGAANLSGNVQDTLQSIYFSIPDRYFELYDDLKSLRMTYLKCLTHWALLTGNKDVYNGLQDYLGVDLNGSMPSDPMYEYRNARGQSIPTEWAFQGDGVSYNMPVSNSTINDIGYLALLLPTDTWGVDIADDYIVPWETLRSYMIDYHDDYDHDRTYWDASYIPPHIGSDYEPGGNIVYKTPYGGEYLRVNGKTYAYSRALFDIVPDKETVIDIDADTEYSLTNMTIGKKWWDGLFGLDGKYEIASNDYDGIQAIKIVGESDFKASEQITCDELYIDRNDYEEFKQFYDEQTAKGETVVIVRYDVSQYQAVEVRQGKPKTGLISGWDDGDTNARAFRQYVYLDLDVISLTFGNGEETVEIPVISDPIDGGRDSTPALDTNSDKDYWGLVWWLAGVGGVMILGAVFGAKLDRFLS